MGAQKRLFRHTANHCEIPDCKWPHAIQRHHILPKRNGGGLRGNLIALCPNHHWEADNEIIAADFLREIVAKRLTDSGTQAK